MLPFVFIAQHYSGCRETPRQAINTAEAAVYSAVANDQALFLVAPHGMPRSDGVLGQIQELRAFTEVKFSDENENEMPLFGGGLR